MYFYSAYGLGIQSEIPLPALMPSEAPADITMRFGNVTPIDPVAAHTSLSLQFREDKAFFFVRGLGSGQAVSGREIMGAPEPDMEQELMQFLAQGPGLSVLLYQRGYLTLHAGCVRIGDGAIAFMGESGAGKSTIAAALHVRGHELIADDVTVINNFGTRPETYPGYPGLNLLPDGAKHFGARFEKFVNTTTLDAKTRFHLQSGLPQVPIPLTKIYLLCDGPHSSITPLAGHRAAYELVKHSYWIRVMHDFRPSLYFLRCAQLSAAIPIMMLMRPKEMSALPRIADSIEKDALLSGAGRPFPDPL